MGVSFFGDNNFGSKYFLIKLANIRSFPRSPIKVGEQLRKGGRNGIEVLLKADFPDGRKLGCLLLASFIIPLQIYHFKALRPLCLFLYFQGH